ncbi:putative DHH family exopolyphosphatase [Spiroplasma mirum ATCC 29335]|nr:putative DHH family exopolyphosphatase [Spiroplasma mirum ATCC 29335]
MLKMREKMDLILAKIKEYDKIICLRHISPDEDAYGSSFGLANFIKENYPTKKVLTDGEANDNLSFLGVPEKLTAEDYQNALVIVTDTANTERIDSLYWQTSQEVIKIDHHPDDTPYGDLSWVDAKRIAASEMVSELVFHSKLKVSPETARLLYTGIITDSNRFLFRNTTNVTLILASKLLATGFDVQEIYQNLYLESWANVKFKNYLQNLVEISAHGVGYIKITDEMLQQHQMTYDLVKGWVNILANIKEIKIWLFFIENKAENFVSVSMRSRHYNVNKVAKKYHGGGHLLASGIKMPNWNWCAAIINDLDNLIINNDVVEGAN